MMIAPVPASEKQLSFVRSLMGERTLPAEMAAIDPATLNKREASLLIERLLKMPKTPKPAAAAKPSTGVLDGLPKSRYALLAEDVAHALTSVNLDHNDMLFVEIREFKGTVYMRRLVGSPGAYLRARMVPSDVAVIAGLIRTDPLAAAQRYGREYSVCGKCGAELTDEESRRLSLGPVCRGAFGL